MQQPDMRPAVGLFLTLYGALKRLRDQEPPMKELSQEYRDNRFCKELVNCFDPASYRFSVFDITLDYWFHKELNKEIALVTIRDEGQGNHMNTINLDISDPNITLETLWVNLLHILAFRYPDTLTRIAESGDDILENLSLGELYVLGGKHRFSEPLQTLYVSLTSPLLDNE
ncbi:hypothetical protein HWC35_gp003 [Vibrio phage USC-1]|uniref:Uncharacterized protein n=2 Tax=Aphroditevirus USC1 TaxID=2846605 RepID=A0A514A281_9CAUD|nr:hypothetical protein HWC35_gp003 [Vibrio phage USC-1]QCW23119.1 hypothetical protein [Vibrio phage 5 TSL-2019]QDH47397.1 hypothetical protein [Vibrio phage USC-1]